jgi:hypothetical protein
MIFHIHAHTQIHVYLINRESGQNQFLKRFLSSGDILICVKILHLNEIQPV